MQPPQGIGGGAGGHFGVGGITMPETPGGLGVRGIGGASGAGPAFQQHGLSGGPIRVQPRGGGGSATRPAYGVKGDEPTQQDKQAFAPPSDKFGPSDGTSGIGKFQPSKDSGRIGSFKPTSSDTRADRNFNPGNIAFGPWAKSHGATGSAGEDTGHGVAVFPSPEAGFTAMKELAQEKYNSGRKTANQLIAAPGG